LQTKPRMVLSTNISLIGSKSEILYWSSHRSRSWLVKRGRTKWQYLVTANHPSE
jgi:hypothetical protein